MINNASYNDRTRYILECPRVAPLIITDPIGWEESDEEFARTMKYIGIVTNFSNNLKFVGSGLEFIENIIDTYGINETITIRKEKRNSSTDEWEKRWTSTLNLTTKNVADGVLSVSIASGGFDKIFKSRQADKIEIERTTSIDGENLPTLATKNIEISGRELSLVSKVENGTGDEKNYRIRAYYNDVAGASAVIGASTFIAPVKYREDQQTVFVSDEVVPIKGYPSIMLYDNSNIGSLFYALADKDKDVTFNIDFEFNIISEFFASSALASAELSLVLIPYKGTNYTPPLFTEVITLHSFGWGFSFPQLESYTASLPISLLENDSYALALQVRVVPDAATATHLEAYVDIEVNRFSVTVKEVSNFDSTRTDILPLHDLGERQSQIITGKSGRFKSSILGRTELGYPSNGKWANLGAYCGHWLRGFGLQDEKYKKFSTSWKDYEQTLNAVLNVHIGFQNIDGEEQIIAEDYSYFFNPNIGLVLPNPLTNVKRSVASDIIYTSILGGYEKGGEVEGLMGLDEPNGKANWVSNLTTSTKTYTQVSKYIAGEYLAEKQRRLQKNDNPTTDASEDTSIFLKDMIDDGTLRERKWDDDSATLPTGIFSPETLTNIRISPGRNLRRHSKVLATPLAQYQDKHLSFGSSTANSAMTTQLIGESPISENEDILNADLGKRIFEPFYIEGEHVVSKEIMDFLKGYTTLHGVKIPNFYFKVQFTIEGDSTKRYGHIMNLKPSGAGQWRFIESIKI